MATDDFLRDVRARLEGEASRLALATVVRTRGSTPRKVGARMLIDPKGGTAGTIGGGCGEADVLTRSQRVLATGVPERVEVRLLEEDGWDSPSICGGILDVFVERLDGRIGGIEAAEFWSALDGGAPAGKTCTIVTVTDAPSDAGEWLGRKAIVVGEEVVWPLGHETLDGAAHVIAAEAVGRGRSIDEQVEGGWRLFAEPVASRPELIVVGAGHVGAALVELAAPVGFEVTVIDDRPRFANPARIPQASRILVGDPEALLSELPDRPDRFVVIVTRGHRQDAECLREMVGRACAYLGMIGSRRRVRRIREWILEQGASPADLEKLHAPIGLAIGAETPSEIAVSILAEMIEVRRGQSDRKPAPRQ